MRTSLASVGHTSARIAIPPICSGHIDRSGEGFVATLFVDAAE
jgi:hypothetical protein